MDNLNNRVLFTAVFERYEKGKKLFEQKTHFREVRTENGSLVARNVVFNEEITARIQAHLTIGEYVSFIANTDFKDIEFQYPHNIGEQV